ncbi:sulfatase family protein [Paludisphaera rhizosphaerae]|uniref:sulfatase family protein n=1 Tax=Paludisphaera rhizosphaerae TaxID=2711216 RepID=UPI0013EC9681|nr:sulfatase-like hydrolase/transferase [Paludisphaera rhizosphaerae]
MKRIFAFLAMIATSGAVVAAEGPRTNIIAVVTDDQAAWTVGCYGNPEAKTPNMDRLAKEGARFANAFSVTPVCSPSRASFMTGRHGIEVGITDWIAPVEAAVGLPVGVETWPGLLQKAGYETALVGKWHLGVNPDQHPTRRGFDHFFGHLGGGWSPKSPTFEVEGKQKTFDGLFSVDVMTDEVLRWMRENKDGPFAISVHYREPHVPYAPMPPEDEAVYKDLDPKIPDSPLLDRNKVKTATRRYYSAIRAVDRNLGRILDELDSLKLADRTIVMFTSDHGYNIGQHVIQHKGNGRWIAGGVEGPTRPNMWDTSLRIPLLIRWPGVARPNTVIDETVRNIDTMATVCGMLGVPVAAGSQRGRDFSPLLRGETPSDWDQDVYGAYDLHNGALAYMRMVRTPKWKLVRHLKTNFMDELYDLANDPGETRNLYDAPAAQAEKAVLQAKLDAWRASVGDPIKD